MTDHSDRTFTSDFRRFFLRGLVVLLPSVLTLWIVVKGYQFVDNTIAEPINRGVRMSMVHMARVWEPLREAFDPTLEEIEAAWRELPAAKQTEGARASIRQQLRTASIGTWWNGHWYMDLIGLAVAIISVYIAGRLVGGFLGRRVYRRLEVFLTQLPVVKQVYPYVKQIVDFLFSDDQPMRFNRVVALEYPRKGVWSIGFSTGAPMRSVQEQAGDSITVFVPSSPTPFTGYTITVPKQDVVEVPISIEEAMRFAISGGVLVPDHQQGPVRYTGVGAATPGDVPSGLMTIPVKSGESADDKQSEEPAKRLPGRKLQDPQRDAG